MKFWYDRSGNGSGSYRVNEINSNKWACLANLFMEWVKESSILLRPTYNCVDLVTTHVFHLINISYRIMLELTRLNSIIS